MCISTLDYILKLSVDSGDAVVTNRFRYPLTLTICLASLLLGTDSPIFAGHKHTLIFKARQSHDSQSEKQAEPSSSGENNSQASSSDGAKKEDPLILKQENLQIEVLTGGKWVPLDTSRTHLKTINQPLRISYQHFQQTPDKVELNLVLKPHVDRFVIAESDESNDKNIPPLKLIEKIPDPYGYLAQDQFSAIFPRLSPGIYSLTISIDNQSGLLQILRQIPILELLVTMEKPEEKPLIVRLNIADAPLQPPIISSVDQRLAREEGKLSLQFKNVIPQDKVTIFVNGLEFPHSECEIDYLNLNDFSNFDRDLPPGTSKVVARIQRADQTSDYSKPVTVTSRSTVVLSREIEVTKTDFPKSSANKQEETRILSEKEFTRLKQNNTDLGDSESKQSEDKIAIQEYAFPYPAAFPISHFSQSGGRIKTEGAVLDQMRLAISKDGRYQLDFDASTTMRAEIKLQLFIKLKGGEWYPITLPRQTILPTNSSSNRFDTGSGNETSFVSITGYAPILVNRANEITDIRRRGSATFGTRPVDSSY